LLAVAAATAIARTPWPDVAMIGVATLAGLVSGYSRPVGVAAIRFIVYLVLSLGLIESAGINGGDTALIFGLGALWNIILRVVMSRGSLKSGPPEPGRPQKMPTPAQRRAHWRRGLRTLSGWQLPLRLAIGLAVASLIRLSMPAHHFYWIILNVALLTQRPIEHLPAKALQRMLGTALGVGVTWLLLMAAQFAWVLAVTVCLLAASVPIVRARSYLLYAAISTALILLVMDLGQLVGAAMLGDRLVATFIGAAIVIAGNIVFDRLLPRAL
jgi:hypothetical protein